jgi:hypothetical protein
MLTNIVIISIMVFAIWYLFLEDEIFGIVNKWFGRQKKWQKPLYTCPACMAPWWGTLIYFGLHYAGIESFSNIHWTNIVITVFGSLGLNAILLKLFGKDDQIIKELKKENEQIEVIRSKTKSDKHFIN